jgi:hypothetical protein
VAPVINALEIITTANTNEGNLEMKATAEMAAEETSMLDFEEEDEEELVMDPNHVNVSIE